MGWRTAHNAQETPPPSHKTIHPNVSSAKGLDAGLELPEPTQLVGPVRVPLYFVSRWLCFVGGLCAKDRAHSTILSGPLLTGAGYAQPTLVSSPRVGLPSLMLVPR